ncbi:MAG: hypothetical protein U5L72_10440 [Bacteroidales bacterium]|nr:hypothetical protein [Bacteroidales bacterium]
MGKVTKDGHEYSDSDLVKGCAGGDRRSQEILYKRYFSFAMSICIRYTRDESEAMEIVNDSYMKVLNNSIRTTTTHDRSNPGTESIGKHGYKDNLSGNSSIT